MNKTLDFIRKARLTHGDKYDYSLCNYVKAHTNVVIICPEHGEFTQVATNHLSGRGCRKCGVVKCSESNTKGLDHFIAKSVEYHGSRYDYSKTKYSGTAEKVIIICPEHGEFEQEPHNHYNKGCYQCMLDTNRWTIEEFVSRAREIHGDKFDYSKTTYVNCYTKVVIICQEHGEFEQTPEMHLRSIIGCPNCISPISSMHQKIIDIIPKNVESIINDRNMLNGLEIDLYLPKQKLGIEINGGYWHGMRFNNIPAHARLKRTHANKSDLALKAGIELLQFWDFEITDNFEIIRSMIRNKLGLSKILYARKLSVKQCSNNEVREFVDSSHLQGHRNAPINLVLTDKDDIVALLSFSKHKRYGWEIVRYCNKLGHSVVGGFQRLLKYFIKTYSPSQILTFADRRYSQAQLYFNSGFRLLSYTQPNYFYFKAKRKYSRQKFQKHKLKTRLASFDNALTETENLLKNGYSKVYDAGHYKMVIDIN